MADYRSWYPLGSPHNPFVAVSGSSADLMEGKTLTPGSNYTVAIEGGLYEFITSATDYGAGLGITLNRIMPDGVTPLVIDAMTVAGSILNHFASGKMRIDIAADVVAPQVIFGRINA